MFAVQQLAGVGLGLDYEELRLESSTAAWVDAGAALTAHVANVLEGAAQVEHIGSSAVVDLLAKPIVDVAAGLGPDQDVDEVLARLDRDGWVYRGDAGDEGGHIFVLEDRPWHRVAHLHVVALGGDQWRRYRQLRDLLRQDPAARRRYEAVKVHLHATLGNDRVAYTEGKSEVVRSLLAVQ